MKVACLVPYPLNRAPSQRFRVEQWAPHLVSSGITIEFFPFLTEEAASTLHHAGHLAQKISGMLAGVGRRLIWLLRNARHYDVVVVHREAILLGVDWLEYYLSRVVPTIFDFDDAIWLPNLTTANKKLAFLKRPQKIDSILRWVTAVSAGCDFLANHARLFNPHTFIVPTSIDLSTYSPPREHQESPVLAVGWTGSVSTGGYLELLREPLRQASRLFPMEMTVVGARVELPGVTVRYEPWMPLTEVPLLRTFDVGLKPAANEEWAKGKCPMKDIQYMALGIPPIASRFGTAVESIEHGVNGLLCESNDDWVAGLQRLRNVDERRRMGASARHVVETRYAATIAAEKFSNVLRFAKENFHV